LQSYVHCLHTSHEKNKKKKAKTKTEITEENKKQQMDTHRQEKYMLQYKKKKGNYMSADSTDE